MKSVLMPLFVSASLASSAHALVSSEDIMQNMEPHERANYLTGSVDMMIFKQSLNGAPERGQCIRDLFYGDDRTRHWQSLINNMSAHGDLLPQTLIAALVRRECGQ